jgi:hypothetical protein
MRLVSRGGCPALLFVSRPPNATPTVARRAARVAREVLLWALSLMLIVVFTRAGLDKFDDGSGWARAFAF